ncbi:MAG TPA: MDR family MFS transporter [Candidatus Dormibacteraeota bacterium]
MTAMGSRGMAAGESPTRQVMTVFVGLMLGTFVSSLNLTLVAPAMPTIVAQLGGLEHYSWIALSSIIASTVIVPIAGKLSDLHGRKPYYMAGILLFMTGSVLSGLAPTFWFLVGARAVQGLGIGTMLPLSQAIIGDLIPPRERGKYQGLIGGVFGLASILGPVIGGFITDHLTWRALFFVNVPVGLATLAVIGVFMRIPHDPHRRVIDVPGIVTLTVALLAGLMATELGGTQFPWLSPQIIGLYAIAAAAAAVFVLVERRAVEPVLPLGLWRNPIFTFSNLANMGVAAGMLGAIYFIPIFVQGVIGQTAGNSGAILLPMLLTMIAASILNGLLMSRTGRYKAALVGGVAAMGAGYLLLTLMDTRTDSLTVVRNMVVIGLGLGIAMQTFTVIVQNAVPRADLGVATSATQMFRSIGSAIGVAVMGSLLTSGMASGIPRHLPASALDALRASGGTSALTSGSALDPALLTRLPQVVQAGIRAGMADALHQVYLAGLPFLAMALVATLLVREIPLRSATRAGDASGRAPADLDRVEPEAGVVLADPGATHLARARVPGMLLALAADQLRRGDRAQLRSVVTHLGCGDESRGQQRLRTMSLELTGATGEEDGEEDHLSDLLARAVNELPIGLRQRIRSVAAGTESQLVLLPGDVEAMERLALTVAAALLIDLSPWDAGETAVSGTAG